MKKTTIAALFSIMTFGVGLPVAWADCGAPEVCTDVIGSFAGHLEQEGINLHWDTDSENAEVESYSLYRISGTSGSVLVYSTERQGTCEELESYGYVDHPGPGDWDYKLVVIKMDNSEACTRTITPQEQ